MQFRTRIFSVVTAFCALIAVGAEASPASADNGAKTKIAIFPFELMDREQEGEFIKKVRPEETARLKTVTDEMKTLLSASGRYDVLDLSADAAKIDAASPFSKCDGCEVDIAKSAGAELAVTGVIDKLNDALLSMQIFVRDVSTGQVKKASQAEMRGNTDELWLRGVRWIWKNRLNVETTEAAPK